MYFFIIICEFFIFTLGAIDFSVFRSGNDNDSSDTGALDVKVDGSLDLPPEQKWEHSLKTETQTESDTEEAISTKGVEIDSESPIMRVTPDGLLKNGSWHKVKDDEKIKDFTVHVYKQAMKVFDTIKRKISRTDIIEKVDKLAKSYKDKFTEFVQETRETDIRTGSGVQRVILHTIDTSNLILQRLVNFLKVDMSKLGIAGVGEKNLQKEVDIERDLEYKHACAKYGYCRTSQGFRELLRKMIKLLIDAPDPKLRQAMDALTEVLKNSDLSGVLDEKSSNIFKQHIDKLEKTNPFIVRNALRVLLGVLSKSESPIVTADGSSNVVAKTAAFYQIMDTIDRAMPANEANKLEWNDILNMLTEWKNGKRKDILEIMQAFETNVRKGVQKMDIETQEKIKKQINTLQN